MKHTYYAYRQNPPSLLELMQHDARLLRLHRVHRLAVGETLRKSHHALRQPDLPQLLIFLLSQLLVSPCVAIAELRARLRSTRVVEDNLLVERLVARPKRGIVHGQKRQLRRNDFGYRGGRHARYAFESPTSRWRLFGYLSKEQEWRLRHTPRNRAECVHTRRAVL